MGKKKRSRQCNQIGVQPIKAYSGFSPRYKSIKLVKKDYYHLIEMAISGDAPKDVIRLYQYGAALKRNPKSWPIYIAKFGDKHYPMESITEYLLTRIGQKYGFNLAEAKLYRIGAGEQIRFLSKYFIRDPQTQVLFHGAEIYNGFLDDENFTDEVEKKRMTQDFFTVSFTQKVLKHLWHTHYQNLYKEFMRMLFFDALVGNNDRHMYNWGVVLNVKNKNDVHFSPIYDTARALFWNVHEDKFAEYPLFSEQAKNYIKKYCEKSRPKIGIEGQKNINHFDLVKKHQNFYQKDGLIRSIFEENLILQVKKMIYWNSKSY